MSSKAAEEIPQVKMPDPNQSVVELNITHVVDCGHFWATYGDADTWDKMGSMHQQIADLTDNLGVWIIYLFLLLLLAFLFFFAKFAKY